MFLILQVINKTSGEIEKIPLALKQKIYPLSKDVLQPILTKYVIKDRTLKEPLPRKQSDLLSDNFRIFGSRKPSTVSSKNNNIEDNDKKIYKTDKYNTVTKEYCVFELENKYTISKDCNNESENCDTGLQNCSIESDNWNIESENLDILSVNCINKSENCTIDPVNCNEKSEYNILSVNCKDKSEDCTIQTDVYSTGIVKYGCNQDLDIILNENNYESLQEKKIIREIGNEDGCFAIVIVDK